MKVLIISHNPVSTKGNMGKTILSLFSEFDKQELCQLYIYPSYPDEDRCASYYRVTDKDVLASLYRFRLPGGEIDRSRISPQQGLYDHAEDQVFYKNRKNKSALRRLLRDAMWRVSRWNNRKLRAWLDREQPDCIFVAPGVAKFLYNFALSISKARNIPVVTYICDDYYFTRKPETLLDRLRLKLLQRKIEQLISRSVHLITISEEMREAYCAKFGIETTTLMTGADGIAAVKPKLVKSPRAISYFGNIRCNRYISLGEIGRELDRIREETGEDIRLRIYTGEQDARILDSFSGIRCVELCGFLSGEAYTQARQQADLLLHVEAFDEESIDFARRSISTKIAESMASGIPLLAYGPECLSSIRYLQRNDSAIVAVSREEMGEALRRALTDEALRTRTVRNALAAASGFHDREKISRTLRGILQKAAAESTGAQANHGFKREPL